MKEFIEREALIKEGWFLQRTVYGNGSATIESKQLKDIPTADVVPVVRCKDCKYCRRVDEFEYWCEGFCSPARLVRKDDFCSHGNLND